MSSDLTIADGLVVAFHYTLRNGEGEVIDQSQAEPLWYLHGASNIVPGLEKQLVGKTVGDEIEAVVPPEEGYGERRDDLSQSVHRSEFPKDMELQVGMPIRAEGNNGQAMMLWIEKVEGARVTVTANHPLAGETLHFSVKIAGLREATADEVSHGHAHGPGGHHH